MKMTIETRNIFDPGEGPTIVTKEVPYNDLDLGAILKDLVVPLIASLEFDTIAIEGAIKDLALEWGLGEELCRECRESHKPEDDTEQQGGA